jgi:hypothetical protein
MHICKIHAHHSFQEETFTLGREPTSVIPCIFGQPRTTTEEFKVLDFSRQVVAATVKVIASFISEHLPLHSHLAIEVMGRENQCSGQTANKLRGLQA